MDTTATDKSILSESMASTDGLSGSKEQGSPSYKEAGGVVGVAEGATEERDTGQKIDSNEKEDNEGSKNTSDKIEGVGKEDENMKEDADNCDRVEGATEDDKSDHGKEEDNGVDVERESVKGEREVSEQAQNEEAEVDEKPNETAEIEPQEEDTSVEPDVREGELQQTSSTGDVDEQMDFATEEEMEEVKVQSDETAMVDQEPDQGVQSNNVESEIPCEKGEVAVTEGEVAVTAEIEEDTGDSHGTEMECSQTEVEQAAGGEESLDIDHEGEGEGSGEEINSADEKMEAQMLPEEAPSDSVCGGEKQSGEDVKDSVLVEHDTEEEEEEGEEKEEESVGSTTAVAADSEAKATVETVENVEKEQTIEEEPSSQSPTPPPPTPPPPPTTARDSPPPIITFSPPPTLPSPPPPPTTAHSSPDTTVSTEVPNTSSSNPATPTEDPGGSEETQQEIEMQTHSPSLPQEKDPDDLSSQNENTDEQLSLSENVSTETTDEPHTLVGDEGHKERERCDAGMEEHLPETDATATVEPTSARAVSEDDADVEVPRPQLEATETGDADSSETTATKSEAVLAKESIPTEHITEEEKDTEMCIDDNREAGTQQSVGPSDAAKVEALSDAGQLPSTESQDSAQSVSVIVLQQTLSEHQAVETIQQAQADDGKVLPLKENQDTFTPGESEEPLPNDQDSREKEPLPFRRRNSDSSSPRVAEPQRRTRQRQRSASDSSLIQPLATPMLVEAAPAPQTHNGLIVHEATQTSPSSRSVVPTPESTLITTSTRTTSSSHASTSPQKPTQVITTHAVAPPTTHQTTPTHVSPHPSSKVQPLPLHKSRVSTKTATHTTQSTTLTADTQKATSTVDLPLAYPAAQFSGAYQPVIQVTPSGPVVTLVPTAQLKMASFQQLSQGTERKKATANSPSPVRVGEKKRAVVHPEAVRTAVIPQLPSIQRMFVPHPQTLESTEVVKCHLEHINTEGVASQTEPTTTKSSQSESTKKLPLQQEPTVISSQLKPSTTAKHQHGSQSVVTQGFVSLPLSAVGTSPPVARVPVVQRVGSSEEVGERGVVNDSSEGDTQAGGKGLEKLKVQKAEILGAGNPWE